MTKMIDFRTEPSRYRHWRMNFDGAVAHLVMDVDPAGGLFEGYELKLNSYDLGVDIELHDAVQRLRFEHPEVRAVVLRGEIIENYPEDARGHSCLILGAGDSGRAVHVVALQRRLSRDNYCVSAGTARVESGFPNEEKGMRCMHCRGTMTRTHAPFHIDRKGYHLSLRGCACVGLRPMRRGLF